MIFLDPKSDMVFKRLFGSVTHKEILISFLNSVLERVEGTKIVAVAINDPANHAETPLSKVSIVDVRCTDQRDNQYIVEMQVVDQQYYAARAQYYSSLALGRQLASGEPYKKLVPVIFVGILNFDLFKNKSYLTHHFILDSETHKQELKHLEFHFVELGKFDKKIEDTKTVLDKWTYVLKHAAQLQEVPKAFKKEPAFEAAFTILAQSNWSKKELEAYDRYLDVERSAIGQLAAATEKGLALGMEKGMEKGIEKGMEKGIEKGIERGIEKGKLAAKLEVATNLLKAGLKPKDIAIATGLTSKQITELKKK